MINKFSQITKAQLTFTQIVKITVLGVAFSLLSACGNDVEGQLGGSSGVDQHLPG